MKTSIQSPVFAVPLFNLFSECCSCYISVALISIRKQTSPTLRYLCLCIVRTTPTEKRLNNGTANAQRCMEIFRGAVENFIEQELVLTKPK